MHQLKRLCGVIGPFFFETDEGIAVTVNREQCRYLTSTQLWPNVEELVIETSGFSRMERPATPHVKYSQYYTKNFQNK